MNRINEHIELLKNSKGDIKSTPGPGSYLGSHGTLYDKSVAKYAEGIVKRKIEKSRAEQEKQRQSYLQMRKEH
jgi:hypothetical protein